MTFAGAVLCGGASRRMGTDKSVIELDGVAMAERVARTLEAAGCDPVVFVGGDQPALEAAGRTYIPDRWPGEGPLGALVSTLAVMATAEPPPGGVVVCACDLPDLTLAAVQAVISADLLARPDVVVADSGRLEPMLACWNPSAVTRIGKLFDAGERALHEVVHVLDAVIVPVDPGALRNVNRPADLRKHRRPPTG